MAHLLDPDSPESMQLFSLLSDEEFESVFPFPTVLRPFKEEDPDCECAFCLLQRREDGLEVLHSQTLGYLMRLVEYIHVMGDKIKVESGGKTISLVDHLKSLSVDPSSGQTALSALLECIDMNMDLIDALWEEHNG